MSPLMRKVLLLILMPLFALSIITSFFTIYSINSYLTEKVFEDLLNEALYESTVLEKKLIEIETAVSVLSYNFGYNFDMDEFHKSGDLYMSEFRELTSEQLLNVAEKIHDSQGIYFMTGPPFATIPSQVWYYKSTSGDAFERILEYPDMKDYFNPINSEGPYWSDPYIDKDTRDSFISYTSPVWNNSEIIGIVGLDLSLQTIEQAVSQFRFLESGYAFLLNSQSNIIYHPHFKSNTPITDALGKELDFLTEELMSGNEENTVIYNFRGDDKRLGYNRLDNDWVFGITTFESEIFKPVRLIRNILLVTNATILFITALIAYFSARFISNPIIQLTKEIRSSTLDLESTIKDPRLLERRDEIGNLSREFRQMQNAFQGTLNKLIENNVSLDRLAQLGNQVASFTHEIKSPIGVVLTSTTFTDDLLEDLYKKINNNDLKKSQMIEMLDNVKKGTSLSIININQVTKIIDSFKDFAVSQSHIRLEKIDLKKLIENVGASISLVNKNKNIKIEKNIASGIELESISGYLTQVFTNLYQNSINHGFYGRKDGRINIDCTTREDQIIIEYSDDGLGIPEEYAPQIFNPYFTSAEERGGTGLGLHIIQTIVQNYLQGSIEYIKDKSPGVLFRITLPRR